MSGALELLRTGDYARGLELFEARESRLHSKLRQLPFPEWRGEDLTGKRIMVQGEQGLGDEIQMARFIPRLRELGAAKVFILCHELNLRLFQCFGADFYCQRRGRVSLPDYDYWVGMLSLPHILGVRLETLSGDAYLPCPPAVRTDRVGLAWTGSVANPHHDERSLPSPDLLAGIPGGVLLEPTGDMLDSAQTLAGLNAVVTVCTSWAHLAGAMGIPTFILLHHQADWRWGLGDRTPWYKSAWLYRQASPGDWSAPIASIQREIRTWTTNAAPSEPGPPAE